MLCKNLYKLIFKINISTGWNNKYTYTLYIKNNHFKN